MGKKKDYFIRKEENCKIFMESYQEQSQDRKQMPCEDTHIQRCAARAVAHRKTSCQTRGACLTTPSPANAYHAAINRRFVWQCCILFFQLENILQTA
jgi:hypothetical protein